MTITVSVTSFSQPVWYAAEEMYRLLRMMMPRADIRLSENTNEKDGFRIGLMRDFGLDTSDAKDERLDDIVSVDTDEKGGVIAGSNPGAVLIAVYRYLRFQGCRWLYPGTDGEYIPLVQALKPVHYRKMADHRFRGQCNEGSEYQDCMLETIAFTPKLGMNTYMLEFDIPSSYYDKYYLHKHSAVRAPEPVTKDNVLQWKRECETEIRRRGLHFHDMGHGWTAEPFGLDSKLREVPPMSEVPESALRHIAMKDGERVLRAAPIFTEVCMSNPETRHIMVNYIADYAATHRNVDYLHIWLSDGQRNHCECEECVKKTASDWYLILLNEVDAELAKRQLDTHLVFIAYTETFWAPVEQKLINPARFTLLYAPIFRLYTETYGEKPNPAALRPYQRNHNEQPHGMADSLAYLDAWKKVWPGDCFCYEYHFWRHQYYDPAGLKLARVLYDDVRAQHARGLEGIVEDGSQRSFFPNGFAFYVYGETLFDSSVSFEELQEDYFSHAYGENWREVLSFLREIGSRLDFAFLSGLGSEDESRGAYYAPARAAALRQVRDITAAFRPVIEKNAVQPCRPAVISWRLLGYACEWFDLLSEAAALRAGGEDEEAAAAFARMSEIFSAHEVAIERYYDHGLAITSLSRVFGKE